MTPTDLPFISEIPVRRVATLVSGFSAARSLARASDLIATVPDHHTEVLRAGMVSFPLPLASTPFMVSMLWHPRMDANLAHRWLRGRMQEICGAKDCGYV